MGLGRGPNRGFGVFGRSRSGVGTQNHPFWEPLLGRVDPGSRGYGASAGAERGDIRVQTPKSMDSGVSGHIISWIWGGVWPTP